MMDGGEIPRGEEPPFHAPVFVVTHRPHPAIERLGGTTFTYVTDGIASAIEQARRVAGSKNVAIAGGGTLLRQVIKLGLLDELELHVVPVILGDGMRLLDSDIGLGPKEGIELTPLRVIGTPEATHIRYKLVGRTPLGVDYRVAADEARVADAAAEPAPTT
jgi:riboflavin biosynthesis pyrimidine reductase